MYLFFFLVCLQPAWPWQLTGTATDETVFTRLQLITGRLEAIGNTPGDNSFDNRCQGMWQHTHRSGDFERWFSRQWKGVTTGKSLAIQQSVSQSTETSRRDTSRAIILVVCCVSCVVCRVLCVVCCVCPPVASEKPGSQIRLGGVLSCHTCGMVFCYCCVLSCVFMCRVIISASVPYSSVSFLPRQASITYVPYSTISVIAHPWTNFRLGFLQSI